VLENWRATHGRPKLDQHLSLYVNPPKSIKYLNETLKLLGENSLRYNIGKDFLNKIPMAQKIRARIGK
jgi:hypothetical protein